MPPGALTNSEICCQIYFHPEPEAWAAVAASESAEMRSRGKYALTSDAEGFILVLRLLRQREREGKCCIQNTLFPPYFYLALLVREMCRCVRLTVAL